MRARVVAQLFYSMVHVFHFLNTDQQRVCPVAVLKVAASLALVCQVR